jgi:hypothetical protein
MFNLEKSITDWRRQMLAAGIKTPVPLKELESHLRDEIERQMKSGRSEAEAFTTAVQKIGQGHTVQNEFEKVEETEGERKWKEGQIWSGAILGLLQLILIGSVLFNSDMTFRQMPCVAACWTGQAAPWAAHERGSVTAGSQPFLVGKAGNSRGLVQPQPVVVQEPTHLDKILKIQRLD